MNDPLKIVDMNKADLDILTSAHMLAFKGYSNTKIGRNYVRKFLKWFVDYPEGIAIAALYKGNEAGYVVGAPVGYQSKMNKDLMSTAIFGFLTHPWAILNPKILRIVASRVGTLINRKKDLKQSAQNDLGKTISLVGIAVSPEFGGLKIGSCLMDEFESRSREKGFDTMRLSVYDNNDKALALYKKSGWNEFSRNDKTITLFKKINA